MTPTRIVKLIAITGLAAAGFAASPAYAVPDAAAGEATARQNGCLKCHAINKKKDGPSYKDVAAKYKGKSGAEDRLYTHITTGEVAKFPDGHEEEHKIIKTKDQAEIKNLISWILSQ